MSVGMHRARHAAGYERPVTEAATEAAVVAFDAVSRLAARVPARGWWWAGILAAWPVTEGMRVLGWLPGGGVASFAEGMTVTTACVIGLRQDLRKRQQQWRETRGRLSGAPLPRSEVRAVALARIDSNYEAIRELQHRIGTVEWGITTVYQAAGMEEPRAYPPLRAVPDSNDRSIMEA